MIHYITGVPGSGKSLRVMWLLTQEPYAGRKVYSNMEGEGSELPPGHHPIPEKGWQECDDGSVIVVDEAQHFWPQRSPNKAVPPDVSAMDKHRHRGIDMILMTQRYTGVDHHIRGLVGKHEHLKRKMGAEVSRIYSQAEAFDPSDNWALKGADSYLWKYPKEMFGTYKSSVEHTGAYKFKMDKKMKWVLGSFGTAALCAASFAVYAFLPASEPEPETPAPEVQTPLSPQAAQPVQRYARFESGPDVASCVVTPSRCACTDPDGYRLRLPDAVCRNAALDMHHRPANWGTVPPDYSQTVNRLPAGSSANGVAPTGGTSNPFISAQN